MCTALCLHTVRIRRAIGTYRYSLSCLVKLTWKVHCECNASHLYPQVIKTIYYSFMYYSFVVLAAILIIYAFCMLLLAKTYLLLHKLSTIGFSSTSGHLYAKLCVLMVTIMAFFWSPWTWVQDEVDLQPKLTTLCTLRFLALCQNRKQKSQSK